jgi:hypothetical protein
MKASVQAFRLWLVSWLTSVIPARAATRKSFDPVNICSQSVSDVFFHCTVGALLDRPAVAPGAGQALVAERTKGAHLE